MKITFLLNFKLSPQFLHIFSACQTRNVWNYTLKRRVVCT